MKINVTNTAKLQAELDRVQHRCSARTLTPEEIVYQCQRVEKWLARRMFKKDWKGFACQIDPNGQSFPSSYKGAPESTIIKIERGASGWFLVGLHRGFASSSDTPYFRLNDDQKQAMADFAESHQAWNHR